MSEADLAAEAEIDDDQEPIDDDAELDEDDEQPSDDEDADEEPEHEGDADDEESEEDEDESEDEDEATEEVEIPTEDQFRDYEMRQMQRDLEASRRAYDSLSGTIGSELQSLRERNAQLERAMEEGGIDAPVARQPTRQETPERREQPQGRQPTATSNDQRVAKMAMQESIRQFYADWPAAQQLAADMEPHMQDEYGGIVDAISQGDSDLVERRVERTMMKAFKKVATTRAKASAKRKTKQEKNMRKVKKLATPIGTSTKSRKRALPRNPDEWTDEEIAAQMKAQGRSGF